MFRDGSFFPDGRRATTTRVLLPAAKNWGVQTHPGEGKEETRVVSARLARQLSWRFSIGETTADWLSRLIAT